MTAVLDVLVALLIVTGSLLALIAALGLVRLPDLFSRMHAASKAGTAGSGLLVLAVALSSSEWQVWVKCLATMAFFMLTAPIAAHLLAKAALRARQPVTYLDSNEIDGKG